VDYPSGWHREPRVTGCRLALFGRKTALC
jgi:hypothetical protein